MFYGVILNKKIKVWFGIESSGVWPMVKLSNIVFKYSTY